LRRHKERPFFVYLPFNAVHHVGGQNVERGEKVEWQVPAEYLAQIGSAPNEPDQKSDSKPCLRRLMKRSAAC
jgi:hypothetical protein